MAVALLAKSSRAKMKNIILKNSLCGNGNRKQYLLLGQKLTNMTVRKLAILQEKTHFIYENFS